MQQIIFSTLVFLFLSSTIFAASVPPNPLWEAALSFADESEIKVPIDQKEDPRDQEPIYQAFRVSKYPLLVFSLILEKFVPSIRELYGVGVAPSSPPLVPEFLKKYIEFEPEPRRLVFKWVLLQDLFPSALHPDVAIFKHRFSYSIHFKYSEIDESIGKVYSHLFIEIYYTDLKAEDRQFLESSSTKGLTQDQIDIFSTMDPSKKISVTSFMERFGDRWFEVTNFVDVRLFSEASQSALPFPNRIRVRF